MYPTKNFLLDKGIEVEETRALSESASSLIISNFRVSKNNNTKLKQCTHIYTNIYK